MITNTPLVVKLIVKKLIYLINKFSPNNLLESTTNRFPVYSQSFHIYHFTENYIFGQRELCSF
ncbi:hypothetical protein C3496_11035 [Bacillus anthracis]|nr:hypothetical protein C3496_11035 [Bacillus anthracis]THG62857.1 hypothetical protein E7Y01_03625 [Bacillus sp. HUB-I-004]